MGASEAQRPAVDASSPGARTFRARLSRPALVAGYFLARLPLAFVAGLKVDHLDGRRCEVSVPFGWRTANPFGSMYFAALSMAAELSCAGLALMAARGAPRRVSVLPVAMQARFEKMARARTTFVCADGDLLFATASDALDRDEGASCLVHSTGTTPDGVVVARFEFTWSFRRSRR